MIEIIVGIIVLVLAIIGIAQLSRGKDSKSSVNVESAVQTASVWKRALKQALYDPEKLPAVLKYMGQTTAVSKKALSALYQEQKIMRGKVDAAVEKYSLPRQDTMDYLDDIPALANTVSLAYDQLRRGRITLEQFRTYVANDVKDLENMSKRHYALRHARMA